MVWRREKVEYAGKHYELPLSANKGSGLGKALKLINHPVRDEIPITVAALGPKSVAMTAEIADGWLPAFYLPEGADEIWGDALRTGAAKRDPERAPLEVYSGGMVGIGEGLEAERDRMRSQIALYVGGMGAKEKNFYNQVFRRYGYEREADAIQSLYLEGRKDAAEAAIPEDYLARASLIGDPTFVRDRLQALKASGVTTLNVSFLGESRAARVRQCDCLRELVEQAA